MGRLAAEQLVQGRTEQVNVRARVLLPGVCAGHLGREVAWRADDALWLVIALVEPKGQAPVEQIDLSEAPHHHVVGLEIAMNDTAIVGEGECAGDLNQDLEARAKSQTVAREQRLPCRVLIVAEQLAPAHSFDSLPHQERSSSAVDAERMNRHDVGVLEAAEHLGFAHQRTGQRRIVSRDHLERDVAVQRALLGDPDNPHPSATEVAADDEVRVGGSQRNRREGGGLRTARDRRIRTRTCGSVGGE